MCGIVGCAGNINQREYKAFRDMLLMDTLRGLDSTGVLRVPIVEANPPEILKDIGHPLNLWDIQQPSNMFDLRGVLNGSAKVLLGHNRAATFGKVTVDNAHPFKFGEIYGVHNGSLITTKDLEGNYEVDSKHIFYTIHKKGIEHTWKNLHGAATLVWWNNEDKTLNMIRNDDRPLYILTNQEEDAIFWASEAWMIEVAFSRNKISIPKDKDGKYIYPKQIPVDTLFTFKPTGTTCPLVSQRKLEKREPSYKSSFYGWGNNFQTKEEDRGLLDEINVGWAKGLQKAATTFRGKIAQVDYALKSWDAVNQEWEYYITAKIKDTNQRVEIIPTTIKDFNKWKDIINANKDDKIFVKINARPREGKSYMSSYQSLMISSRDVTLSHIEKKVIPPLITTNTSVINIEDKRRIYKGYGGILMTAAELKYQLEKAGQTCLGCDYVFSLDDAESIDWVKPDVCLCKNCSDDMFIQSTARSM